jgi:hypothetical protein
VVTEDDPELELCEEPSDEELRVEESSEEDPVVEVSVVEVPVVDDPFDAFVVVAVELAPRLPVAAITPKASAKVASAPAVIRRRIILMRRARSRSRLRTSGFEEGGAVTGMPAS